MSKKTLKLISNLERKNLFLFDCDGVLWRGETPIPTAQKILAQLRTLGKKIGYITNNSSKSREKYKSRLEEIGFQAELYEIMTSGFATAHYLRNHTSFRKVFLIGEKGFEDELIAQGIALHTLHSSPQNVEAVVLGLDRQFTYEKAAFACLALEKGAQFIVANMDPFLPMEKGNIPGTGAILSMLSTASGKKPDAILGKPNRYIIDLALQAQEVSASNAVIIGDRLTTDVLCGLNSQVFAVHLNIGTREGNSQIKPDLSIKSLNQLFVS
ncbi:MAG: HAD-IIA family hydrolase [Candidatus Hodarchaeota archaeon]